MAETQLEAIRRRIREAEERLKKSPAGKGNAMPPLSAMKDQELAPAPVAPPGEPPSENPDRLREELAAVHRRLRTLQENSRDALILVDSKGAWELANYNLADWLGYTREELQGIHLREVFEPEDLKKLVSALPQWLRGASPTRHEPSNLKGKNGERVPVLLSSYFWIGEGGERAAYLVLEDMRSRRSLEAQIAGIKGFVDAVMREGVIPIFLLLKEGLIVEANRAACQRLGVEREQLVKVRLQDFLAGSTRTDFEAFLSRGLAVQPVTGSYRFRRDGGAEFDAAVTLVGVANSKGVMCLILATMA